MAHPAFAVDLRLRRQSDPPAPVGLMDRRFLDAQPDFGDQEIGKAIERMRPQRLEVFDLDGELAGQRRIQPSVGEWTQERAWVQSRLKQEIFNQALNLGVGGFILKENAVDEIVKAIITVAGGGHYLSSSVSGYLVRRRNREELLAAKKPGLEDLTKAERRILKLIAGKKTSREIGAELFISTRTVEAHRANIITKLELQGTHSLLQFALENRSII